MKAIEAHALEDPDLLRTNLDIAMALRRADEVARDPAIKELGDGHGETGTRQPLLGPSRTELLAAIA